jgi:hypothetical protein
MTASGHIADDAPANPVGSLDGFCDGWLGLSGVDARVFDRCEEILLRLVDGSQPNLSIAGHAALLAAKSLRYPALPKSPITGRRTAALAQ